jgi:hypothetical protein
VLGTVLGFSVARRLEPPNPVIIQAAAPVDPNAAASRAKTALAKPAPQRAVLQSTTPEALPLSPSDEDLKSAVAKGLGSKK